jgi:hypothetical protein
MCVLASGTAGHAGRSAPEPVKQTGLHLHPICDAVALDLGKAILVVFRDHDTLSPHHSCRHPGEPEPPTQLEHPVRVCLGRQLPEFASF